MLAALALAFGHASGENPARTLVEYFRNCRM
jgi:hypothetical protein